MRIFLSWSGERSRQLALALREWLPVILQGTEPWMSEADIGAGERWAVRLGEQLETVAFGVLCVTSENIASPWLLFESGALAKSLTDSRVCPLLLDVQFSDLVGPLSQFQAKKADFAGISELVHDINRAMEHPLSESRLNRGLKALLPQLKDDLERIPEKKTPGSITRPESEVLEDLVTAIRKLEKQVERLSFRIISSESDNRARYEVQRALPDIREILKAQVERQTLDEVAKEIGVPKRVVIELLGDYPIIPNGRHARQIKLWFSKEKRGMSFWDSVDSPHRRSSRAKRT